MPNPVGPTGTWTMVFEDQFTGPGLNTANWTAVQGVTNSGITTQASSVSVSGGYCNLVLAGMINSNPPINGWPGGNTGPTLAVGSCVEASINFAGFAGNSPYNWPAWWVSGQNWPANGEEDIFESYNGTPSALNYHNASGANNGPFPSGNWCNSFHTYTLVRGATTLQCWWDGALVRSVARNDNGGPQSLIVFIANANTSSGTAVSKVDYVRMWTPGGTGGSSPTVVTTAPTALTTTTVTLNGTVNPNTLATTYQFEYGTTTAYGTKTPGSPASAGSGNAALAESAAVTGLTSSTTYHYRLDASNSAGATSGSDQAFTTAGGGGGGGGGALPTLAYSNTASATSALSYRATPATSQSSGTVTTFSVTKQAGTASGDWIFIYLFGTNVNTVACTGFTVKNDGNLFGCLLYRLADGTEASSFSITGLGGNRVSAVIATVVGASTTLDPSVVSTPNSGGASTSIPITSITLANANDWVLWFGGNENGFSGVSYAITAPSGFTSKATNGAQANNPAIMVADNTSLGTGATGTKTGTTGTASFYSGVMVGVTPAAGAGTLTSTSFTPQTGDIIVVKCIGEDAGITFNTPTGGGWTYTSQVSDTTASHVSARIYTAPVTLGGTPQTVAETPTWGAFANAMMTVELWRGAQLAAMPVNCDTRGTGAPSTTLTTTAANSVVTWASGDFADVDGVSRVYNTTSATPTEDGYVFSTARMTSYSAYQSAVTAGSQTLGLTTPTGQTWTLTGLEIQAASSGGTGGGALSYRATPAVTVSSGNVSSWTVNKQAGTASGDWIFIWLFGCDYSATVACSGFTVSEDSLSFGALLYRLADGTEGSSFTITGLGGASPVSTIIATIAGATTALDPSVTPVPNAGGPTTSVPVNGVTLSQTGDWLLWFGGNQNSFTGPGYAMTPPSGFTSQVTNGAAAANATVMLADNEAPGTGATGTKTGTSGSSSYYSGVMVGVTAGTAGPSFSPGATPATGAGTARNATVTTSGAAIVPAVLPGGIARAIQPTAIVTSASTPGPAQASGAGTALNATVQAAPGPIWFPAKSLGIKVELLLNSVWTDITAYTYQRNPVQITGMGRADWTSSIQAAQATLTLNNRDGRFSPKNSNGAFFPFITRNVQLRISVSAQSITGNAYSGYRFWGEVSEWPPRWDPSQRDIYCDIVASGIWRRISQQQTTLGSAFTRYNAIVLTGSAQPRCYWPMEDGTGSGQLVSFDSVAGTGNALQSFITGQPGLSLAASTDFKGSDAIPQLNGAEIIATVPAGGTPTVNCTRFLLSVPAAGDSAQASGNWNLTEIDSTGTVAKFEVYTVPAGTLLMQLRNSAGAVIAQGSTTTVVKGKPVLVSCELTPSGGNVAFALRIIAQNATGITETISGTLASATVGSVTTVTFNRSNVLMDTAVGHLSVTYGTVPLMVPASYALGGNQGETAMDRFTRLCGEQNIAAETIGTASTTAPMGPQVDDTLASLLQSIEATDCGLLYESKNQFGLGYRSNASMANQVVSATFSYPAAILDASLAPAYDDSLTRNNIVVTNWTGYAEQAILTAGPMSVLNPPNGIGNGYAYTRSVNAASDSQAAGIATFLLSQGTVDEVRFPVITLKMNRQSNAPLFTAVPGLRIGDYFQITSPPSFLTAGANIRQLAWGYSETLNAKEWTISFNSVPETPWETGFSPGTTQIAQIPGGSAVTSAAPGAGGLGGIIANGSITPAMLSQGITVHTLGGNAITISAGAPVNPNTGDIWIASATGLISQWDGTVWQPFKFDASQTIQAGTIIAANIAAGAITSGLIAAGTVAAGIVDATIIKAAEILSISTDTLPDYLAYKTSVANGNLVTSIAPVAGTDTVSNAYPNGIMAQQLTLVDQSSAPPAFAGSSELYTSAAGRLRYKSSSGVDVPLERSSLDLTNVTMTTSTTPVIMSRTLSYLAGEAQVGSEYEIEIDMGLITPNTSTATFTLDFFVDGAALGGTTSMTMGTQLLVGSSATFNMTLRYRITVDATGAGGNVDGCADGTIIRQLAFNGNTGTNTFSVLNRITTGNAFDTTSNHSLAIYANWGTTSGSGHNATTYRTKFTRRN